MKGHTTAARSTSNASKRQDLRQAFTPRHITLIPRSRRIRQWLSQSHTKAHIPAHIGRMSRLRILLLLEQFVRKRQDEFFGAIQSTPGSGSALSQDI